MDRNEAVKERLLREMDSFGAAPFVVTDMAAEFIWRLLDSEREECAKVCEERDMHDMSDASIEAKDCAKAIRARGRQQ